MVAARELAWKELIELLRLQASLIRAWRRTLGVHDAQVEQVLGVVPSGGELSVDEAAWVFARHGDGVRFEGPGGVVVDVHSQLSLPRYFDIWRLRLFAGTRPGAAKVWQRASRRHGMPLQQAVKALVEDWVREGRIQSFGEDGFVVVDFDA